MKNYSKKLLFCFILLMGVLMVGCTNTAPQLSQMQIREITTKEIPADYKSTFKATMNIIQDEGWTVENTDFDSGLIVGKAESALKVSLLEGLGGVRNKKLTNTVSATVLEINKGTTRVRLSIRAKNSYDDVYGAHEYGAGKILDKAIYDKLFNLIKIEAERIKAMQ